MSEAISAVKSRLRNEIESKRAAISLAEASAADEKITERLFALPEFKAARTVFCFAGTNVEINTDRFLIGALKSGKRVCLPRCVSKGIMEAYEILSPEDLHIGKYGIREPGAGCAYVRPGEIDFAVIPCVTCDIRGNRLGRGGGYYDRYLSNCSFRTAAICRHMLLSKSIPTEAHDIPIDIVVTETSVYRGNNT